jgi:hypothetical protein
MTIRSVKSIPAICCSALLAAAGFGHAGDAKHLFILSGQSNMAGLNPDLSFTPAVAREFGASSVIVVKDAQGGQPIRRWYKQWKPEGVTAAAAGQGDLYDRLMAKVRNATEGQPLASVTFVWMQGERDAKENHGKVYAESLKGLVAQLEADLDRKDIHVVIGRLSDCENNNPKVPGWNVVREAQVKAASELPSAAWVDTDDLNGPKNGLHYDKPGYAELGKRFAASAIDLIRKPAQ